MNIRDNATHVPVEPVKSSRRRFRRIEGGRRAAAVAAAVAVLAAGGGGVAIATSSSASSSSASATQAAATGSPGGFAAAAAAGGRGNARSGPAAGGTTGTVSAVSGSGFTLKTSAGQTVTVKPTSSTVYRKGTKSASAGAVGKGQPVLVLGTVSSTTITASQVTVKPPAVAAAPSWAGTVVTFRRGTHSAAKTAGQVPASYKQGSGTLVSGAAANKATKAALAVYPGGVVDRVVQLGNGEYEVHNIGVNWPHHIFVNQNFKVVGAD